jgi:hypothetical protein
LIDKTPKGSEEETIPKPNEKGIKYGGKHGPDTHRSLFVHEFIMSLNKQWNKNDRK